MGTRPQIPLLSVDKARGLQDNTHSSRTLKPLIGSGVMRFIPSRGPVTGSEKDSYKSLWMLGAAMLLPLILLSGPLAGYVLGRLAITKLGVPNAALPVLVGLGIVASGIQSFRLIKQIQQSDMDKK